MDVVVNKLKPANNYYKLANNLHPMAYWGGDKHYDVYVTEDADDERGLENSNSSTGGIYE